MFDLKQYRSKLEKGLVTLVKAGDAYAVSTKKFDPETGEDLPDEVVGINMQELLDRKNELQNEIKDIDTFIKDTEVL